ncbi:heme-binding protein [Fuscibacter oryzae]|uniref:Heme-binding protein n=1 Tax=Fuscibacter oryzae TaxID=2803939 RepID=A0A8J7SVD7_9RHOB|nr:heme-binding protein [Fuscibacter oryzae]MBL4929417.1 heme-binding protein [Fuscibacter oryzae]
MTDQNQTAADLQQRIADLRAEALDLRFSRLSQADALDLGEWLLARCRAEGHCVIVGVNLGEQVLYRAALPGTTADSHTWIDRKFAGVGRFGRSTMELELENRCDPGFSTNRGLDQVSYGLFGGGVPLYVGDLMVGAIGVSGLESSEDHRLIVETIRAFKAAQSA